MMDMSSSSAMPMTMVFTTSTTTPLFSLAWTPATTGQYAGTCVFLISLAVVYRLLFAAKYLLEQRWRDAAVNRRHVAVAGKQSEAKRISTSSDSSKALLVTENGVEEEVRVVVSTKRPLTPWRISTEAPRAGIAVLIAGIGYLLMLGVMTMNVGYFMSVLGGTALGELAVGRYLQSFEH
ncbi:MAG: hypothetical protein M1812_005108 [Candelaria pacifica]|nr:MAG: hypothetical protein M1812_005108 [Candelaria pacifica]